MWQAFSDIQYKWDEIKRAWVPDKRINCKPRRVVALLNIYIYIVFLHSCSSAVCSGQGEESRSLDLNFKTWWGHDDTCDDPAAFCQRACWRVAHFYFGNLALHTTSLRWEGFLLDCICTSNDNTWKGWTAKRFSKKQMLSSAFKKLSWKTFQGQKRGKRKCYHSTSSLK